MSAQPIDIIFLLDSSGSMDSMGNEPIQATNRFIKEQKDTLPGDGSTFTLWKFNDKLEIVYDDIDLGKIQPITSYIPCGMTALYDAIGRAICTKMAKPKHDNVICVILTDGQENSSQQYKNSQIRKMIQDAENDHDWKFIYLGANQDAFKEGSNIGVSQAACSSFVASPEGLSQAISQTSAGIRSLRLAASTEPQPQQPIPIKSMTPNNSNNQNFIYSRTK